MLLAIPLSLLTLARAASDEVSSEEETSSEDNGSDRPGLLEKMLYKRLVEPPPPVGKKQAPLVYRIPGPQEPLPGRTYHGDYWPVYPFVNQFTGGLDLDPSSSRHWGGDLNVAVPSWGILDLYGRSFLRIFDTTTKFGYVNHPVNMMDLERKDLMELISDRSLAWNRQAHPTLPIAKLPKTYVPMSCKPPLCNPYHMNFGLGIEHDVGGYEDGYEGDVDTIIPVSKGTGYRFPFSGNIHYDHDNITVTYGHNLSPIDPYSSLFDYQKHRDPALAIPRDSTTGTRRAKRSLISRPEQYRPVPRDHQLPRPAYVSWGDEEIELYHYAKAKQLALSRMRRVPEYFPYYHRQMWNF